MNSPFLSNISSDEIEFEYKGKEYVAVRMKYGNDTEKIGVEEKKDYNNIICDDGDVLEHAKSLFKTDT